MKFTGTSANKKDLLITSSNIIQNSGYLAVVDWSGKIKYQQHFTNGGVKNLKNFTLNDNNYYSYQLDNGNKWNVILFIIINNYSLSEMVI